MADKPNVTTALRRGREEFAELTGLQAEAVSSFEENGDDGWKLRIEVCEVAKIPDTTSLMGSYEVTLGPDGQLRGYHRVQRYERGRADPR
ncbi:gas vesicle protein [Streptomyces sp. A7024]|uniref:Gas vesicle protein n=1 Tax=Streptomyces coryli TaxID=1128680 RepID=A0A6G4U1J5_9ACTN|nr:gas vesicle protein [Streptomyces coryli]NGN66105.1 gas vesicle protein [Streptomyces coryli]